MATKYELLWSPKRLQNPVLYDLFSFGQTFEHLEWTGIESTITFAGQSLELSENGLFKNGKAWDGREEADGLVAFPHAFIQIYAYQLPSTAIWMSAAAESDAGRRHQHGDEEADEGPAPPGLDLRGLQQLR